MFKYLYEILIANIERTYFPGTLEFLRLSSANWRGTGMLRELKKFSSTESRLISGSGDIHVKRVDEGFVEEGIGEGEVQGDVSEDEVGINFGVALSDIFLKFPSLLFCASQCSMMLWMIRLRLLALHWTASFSERFIERLVRSLELILSFSGFPNEKRLLRGSLYR